MVKMTEESTMTEEKYEISGPHLEQLRLHLTDLVKSIVRDSAIYSQSDETVRAWEGIVTKLIAAKYICWNEFSRIQTDLNLEGGDPYP